MLIHTLVTLVYFSSSYLTSGCGVVSGEIELDFPCPVLTLCCQAFLLVFCVLELVDLPPFDMPGPLYGWVDSHCLWHLVTIPINAWIVYGWILEGDAARNGKKGSERQCLHWRNAEQRAIIWTGIFLIVFSVAVVPTWLQSGQLCSQHTRCRRELRPSWLGSMDLSDPQWRAFREKLPLLVAVAVSTTLLRRACPRLKPVAAFLYCLVLHGLGSMIALCRPGVPLVVCFLELEFTKEVPRFSLGASSLCSTSVGFAPLPWAPARISDDVSIN